MSLLGLCWQYDDPPSAAHLSKQILDHLGRGLVPGRTLPARFAARGDLSLGIAVIPVTAEDAWDNQPLADGEAELLFAASVRLDNRQDLARELGIAAGSALRMADSELAFLAWRRWGRGSLDRMLGGFALAVWDSREQTLLLARDHAGERPLFFCETRAGFAAASLPRGLFALPGVDAGIDERQVAEQLGLLPASGAETLFRGIRRLRPGCLLEVRRSGGRARLREQRYWHPLEAPAIRFPRDSDYAEALLERWDVAVAGKLRSTGEVASHLSAGLDSASVATSAARTLTARGQRLLVYTAVPEDGYTGGLLPERLGDEGPYAAQTAALYPGMTHFRVDGRDRPLTQAVAENTLARDRPVFNPPNQVWLDAIARHAAGQGARVLLMGSGGNTTISYGGFAGLAELFRSGRLLRLARTLAALRRKNQISLPNAVNWTLGSLLPGWLLDRVSSERAQFDFSFSALHPERARELDIEARVYRLFFAHDTDSRATRALLYEHFDHGDDFLGALLLWGVELRDPTVDRRIFDFCYGIPIEQYMAGGQSRSLVRRAMAGRIPASTLERTLRALQAADWPRKMRAAAPAMLAEVGQMRSLGAARRNLDLDRMERLLRHWPESGFDTLPVANSWNYALARGYAMGHFLLRYGRG